MFIYALCEPGTRTVRYIGKTGNLKRRLTQHISTKAKTHLGYWVRSLVARGEKPTLVVFREVPEEAGAEAEMRYIRLARGCQMNLVNSTDGGEGLLNPSPETRQKMRERQLGSVHSEEHSFKCGASNRGKHLTPEHRAAIGAANAGRSPASKGVPMSEKTKLKMSAASKGVPKSPEHCATLSIAHAGVPLSASHRASLSAAQKASWARRKERDREIEWALAPYTLE